MKTHRTALIGMVAASLLLAACGSVDQDWSQAQQTNTLQAYQKFIKQYPDSDHVAAARQQIAKIKHQQKLEQINVAWQRTRNQDSKAAYQQFLQKYPESSQASKARNALKQINRKQAWADARQAGSPRALQLFISKYPNSPQADRARSRIAQMKAAQQQQRKKKEQARKAQAQKEKKARAQGDYQVQMAAFRQQESAEKARSRWQKTLADALGDASIKVVKPPNGSSLYRVRTTGMSQDDATRFCQSVKSKGGDCYIVKRH